MQPLATRLPGSIVTLEPLAPRHADALWQAAQAAEIWTWLRRAAATRAAFDDWFDEALTATADGREGVRHLRRRGRHSDRQHPLPERPAGRPRYGDRLDVARAERLADGANVEAKLLMLDHAFDTLGCQRVEFKTDARNERSRAALAALPAQFEGVLRKHMLVPGIGVRDSAYYSVIDDEWPAVRANLEERLSRARIV